MTDLQPAARLPLQFDHQGGMRRVYQRWKYWRFNNLPFDRSEEITAESQAGRRERRERREKGRPAIWGLPEFRW